MAKPNIGNTWEKQIDEDGAFVRRPTSFHGVCSPDEDAEFPAEPGRYHLYVSYACPWAHRTLIFRKLKGLEDMIPVSVVHWYMAENGWTFADGDGVISDPIHDADYMYQVYQAADASYTGRVTVPVLWDKEKQTIVSNESADIIRMFNSAFDEIGATEGDFYPEPLREEIDEINARVYSTVNNGVYKAGFATSQEAYEEAVEPLFESLEWLDGRLSTQRYLLGDRITEADWRLFTTLLRFDPVYVGHFKCNRRRIVDFENLWPYVRDLHQVPGVADTVHMDHIKSHYYGSHDTINPTRIVPVGPDIDYSEPHGRDALSG